MQFFLNDDELWKLKNFKKIKFLYYFTVYSRTISELDIVSNQIYRLRVFNKVNSY